MKLIAVSVTILSRTDNMAKGYSWSYGNDLEDLQNCIDHLVAYMEQERKALPSGQKPIEIESQS